MPILNVGRQRRRRTRVEAIRFVGNYGEDVYNPDDYYDDIANTDVAVLEMSDEIAEFAVEIGEQLDGLTNQIEDIRDEYIPNALAWEEGLEYLRDLGTLERDIRNNIRRFRDMSADWVASNLEMDASMNIDDYQILFTDLVHSVENRLFRAQNKSRTIRRALEVLIENRQFVQSAEGG